MLSAPYTIIPSVPVISAVPERRYVLTVRDLPVNEKPRERLAEFGPTALSTVELLAVLLSTGTVKEDVLSMSSRIIQDYGERSVMSQSDPKALAEDLGIPFGKALQIVAAGELGRRFFARGTDAAPVVRTAREVYEHVAGMQSLSKEHLRGLYLNAHYQVIHDEIISIGTIDANIIHPREVFRPALACAASAVILVHNHPSGIADASDADRNVTSELISAGALLGIEVVDHVIVTKNGFTSVPAAYHA